jgi:hypothetical protein
VNRSTIDVTGGIDAVIRTGLIVLRRVGLHRLLAFGCIVLATLVSPSGQPPQTLDWRLAQVARSSGFDIWSWELRTLATRTEQQVFDPPSTSDGPAEVREYVRLSAEVSRARNERDTEWARQAVMGSPVELDRAQANLDRLESRLTQLRPVVEATLSGEIQAELRRQQVRPGLLTWSPLQQFPFIRPEIVPGVFFQLGSLPDLLVIAPRDRIELIGSVLVQPDLSPRQIDALENSADGLHVSSVVTGIGGLAAYPSIVPDESSVKDLLITVSHEWTHHYLAIRPLGMAYFNSYHMREINETVADIVGHEVGDAVYERYYAIGHPLASRSSAPAPAQPTGKPDFWTLMRRIRVRVEGYLARHDVDGADAYMAAARQDLARQGYYVRRLNTAYLAFFGSYAATANPYEAKLRQLLAQSGSLRSFLDNVSQVRTPADLDRLVSETRNHLP